MDKYINKKINSAKILILEDDFITQKIILNLLQIIISKKEQIHFAKNLKEGEKIFRSLKFPDLILISFGLENNENGINFIKNKEIYKIIKDNNIPIIFLTAKSDEKDLEEAFKNQINDYITKPFKKSEFLLRVKNHLKLKFLIEYLDELANYDYLTKLYNRRKFFEEYFKTLKKNYNNMFIMLFDLDKFKTINDTYGHDVGDLVIKHFSNLLKNKLKELDRNYIAARFGGEEFIILGTYKKREKLKEFLDTLYSADKTVYWNNNKNKLNYTFSCGICANYKYTDDKNKFIQRADQALYYSKKNGRNQYNFYSEIKDKIKDEE